MKHFKAVTTPRQPFPVVERPLSDFGVACPNERSGDPYLVFVSEEVVEDIIAHTLRTEGVEQAGVLIGHLCRDPVLGKAYAAITAHIPATEGVVAGKDSFRFSPDAFMAVKGIVELRKSNEVILGWQHNHHWCPGCPSNPMGSTIFFSIADAHVHASAFSQPFQVAMVAGRDLALDPQRPAVRMYGWRDAGIAELSVVRI